MTPQTSKPKLQIRPEALREARLKALLDRRDLAEMSGLSDRRIEQLEQGHSPGVKVTSVRKLARALRCQVEDITEVVVQERAS